MNIFVPTVNEVKFSRVLFIPEKGHSVISNYCYYGCFRHYYLHKLFHNPHHYRFLVGEEKA